MIDLKHGIPDKHFFYTDDASWELIQKSLTYPADYFVSVERKDCDDYSKKASADGSFYYGLNVLQAWGDSPEGFHAFNLVMVNLNSWRVFEPNAGFACAGKLMELANKDGWLVRKWKP